MREKIEKNEKIIVKGARTHPEADPRIECLPAVGRHTRLATGQAIFKLMYERTFKPKQ